ncbi:MAG: hypothetical protein WBM28_17665 [Burkholderiales bacterium]
MSLVVAQATECGPRITSDIQVGRWDGRKTALKDGTLKAIVLSQWVTICFAGLVKQGLDAVREFAAGLNAGRAVDDLLPMLNRISATGAVDFIVARRHRVEQLTRITENGVERRLPIAWIGDQHGFEQFQRARRKVSPEAQITSRPASVMHELRAAMNTVIDDEAIVNVGGFEIAVANTQAGFEYLGSAYVHPGRDFTTPSAVDDLIPYMIQSAEEGGYTVCLVEPVLAGVPAAALYFPTGGVAMMFLPLQFDTAQVITGVRPTEFTKIVQDRFGIAMKPPGGPLQKQIFAKG